MTSLASLRTWFLSLSARRRHARVRSSVPGEWRVFGSDVRHVSRLGDVSLGGAYVETASPRPVGSPIVLALAVPRGPFEVHARVAWSTSRGMGLRFTTR